MSTALLTPILEGGIRNTHFFQGRLLAAEDLRTEQEANRTHHRQLGRAIGAGVLEGLEVRVDSNGAKPVLGIVQGLALNSKGQTLELAKDVKLALVREPTAIPADASVFAPCTPHTTTGVFTGSGIYILVMSPASGFQERAPMNSLDTNGKAIDCGSRYAVEGVQFRLEQLLLTELPGVSQATHSLLQTLLGTTDPAGLSQLRNLLAHLCYGTEELAGFSAAPFRREDGVSPFLRYGVLDHRQIATDCDVPLALFYWTSGGISFDDIWSVRRRPFPATPSLQWPTVVGERRRAEAEAMFLQFQAHVDCLIRDHVNPSSIEARQYFRFLPPVGFLPLSAPNQPRGLRFPTFFAGKTYRGPSPLAGDLLHPLITRAREFPPLDLASPEMINLYQVRENSQLAEANNPTVQPYLIFANGYISGLGEARYNLTDWNFGDFA